MKRCGLWLLLLVIQVGIARRLKAQGFVEEVYEGTLGDSRIGMVLVHSAASVTSGHYFEQKTLQDIPLNGVAKNGSISLLAVGGGSFDLHFIGNGSNGAQPLTFENSIGMEGTWTSDGGKRTLPVKLTGAFIPVGGGDRWYAGVTHLSDAAFEARVQVFWRGVLDGDRHAVVQAISYPLTVYGPGAHQVRKFISPASVLRAWDTTFTPALIADLKNDLPHDMFVHDGLAMLGRGEAWFDGKGLKSLNVPAP
jgi:hypothetical protein